LEKALEFNIDAFLKEAESKLPPVLHFDPFHGNHRTSKQLLGKQPLYVMTVIFENEVGEMRPFTTPTNGQWIQREIEQLGHDPSSLW
jgi:hypothetical protein